MNNSGFAISIPHFYCHVRTEYLYNLESHKGEIIPCLVFGADTVLGRAIGFDILTDFGGMFARLPVSALVHKTEAPDIPLDFLQLWGNFSYHFEAVEYSAIRGINCEVILKDKKWYPGRYMFTFSWYGAPYAEDAGEGGFKRAHMIELENGCYTLQPNNRMKFHEGSFITKPWPENPDFKTNSRNWWCEDGSKWVSEDSDKYFYDIKQKAIIEDLQKTEEMTSKNTIFPINIVCPNCNKSKYLEEFTGSGYGRDNEGWLCTNCNLVFGFNALGRYRYRNQVQEKEQIEKCKFVPSTEDCSGASLGRNIYYYTHPFCFRCGKCAMSGCTNFESHD